LGREKQHEKIPRKQQVKRKDTSEQKRRTSKDEVIKKRRNGIGSARTRRRHETTRWLNIN